MSRVIKIIVTGEYEDLDSRFPVELGHQGKPFEWMPIKVLNFEKLLVDVEALKHKLEKAPDWILFTSQRSVRFWSELLMEAGIDFPIETQVACIGEKTAEAANQDGFTPDFYPTEPGTEKFLEEFADLISNNSIKPTVLIPMAEGGRTLVADKLREWGCEVELLPLYRTMAREDIARDLTQEELALSSLILFTSPSSVDAFLKVFSIPDGVRVAAIGKFTSDHLNQIGLQEHALLPGSNFERMGELLC